MGTRYRQEDRPAAASPTIGHRQNPELYQAVWRENAVTHAGHVQGNAAARARRNDYTDRQ